MVRCNPKSYQVLTMVLVRPLGNVGAGSPKVLVQYHGSGRWVCRGKMLVNLYCRQYKSIACKSFFSLSALELIDLFLQKKR